MSDVLCAMVSRNEPCVLAIIVGQDGPAYRPLGAMMAVFPDGEIVGHLSSGCIEADIITQCQDLKQAKILTYGKASSPLDLRLPCGGAMEVLLIPSPDLGVILQVNQAVQSRTCATLRISLESGQLGLGDGEETARKDGTFYLRFEPPLQFFVFGNGHEARVFAELVHGAGFGINLFSTAESIFTQCTLPKAAQHLQTRPKIDAISDVDEWSSITLFFHDHDQEEHILADALKTNAFYIGAQGSIQTHQHRIDNLVDKGLTNVERIKGPIGLIPRTRDPQALAISVLAEIQSLAPQSVR